MGMADRQCGHSFVAGAVAGASSFFFKEFIPRIRKKMAKATIRKLTTVFTNSP